MPIVLRDGKGTTRGKSLSEYPRNIIHRSLLENRTTGLCNYIMLISILPHWNGVISTELLKKLLFLFMGSRKIPSSRHANRIS